VNFKFSKNQTVQALFLLHEKVKPGTKGTVKTHRRLEGDTSNQYLVKFKGHANYFACSEHELDKV
jgi:hypothetical protein